MTSAVQTLESKALRRYKFSLAMARAGASLNTVVFTVVLVAAVLALAGFRTAYVVSDSMKPAFSSGDLLIVSKNYDELAVGDIVLYDADWSEDLVSHRIVEVSSDYLLLKGDSNEYADPRALKSSVFGVVGVVFPNLGWVLNPYAICILLGVGVGLELAASRFEYVGKHRE